MTGPTTARYDGKCFACGGTIIAGDEIVPVVVEIREGFTGSVIREDVQSWEHAVCPTPRGQLTCPVCFLERPCPCEDGQ